jgi:predicted ATPase/DNA-binding winged helix-turn-helix (wHTH) protein
MGSAEHATGEMRSFAFGPFTLVPERQQLICGEEAVRVGSRSLELLIALVERPGELVTKRELIERAWPDTFVEEGNLKVNMAALRRALGDATSAAQYITTVVGRGYRFIAPVRRCEAAGQDVAVVKDPRVGNLPGNPMCLTGRADAVSAILRDLSVTDLLSVVGPGGVGKTAIALAVAEQAASSARDGAWFVDFTRLDPTRSVARHIADALGVPRGGRDALDELCDHLRGRELLLLLDGCEPVVAAVAETVDRLLCDAGGVKILVTSREGLRIRAERVCRVAPLALPTQTAGLTVEATMGSPAVQLFLKRAAACRSHDFSDRELRDVADICRAVDGLPLAIEIAATHADAFGVRDLLRMLREKSCELRGSRIAHARHRCVNANLEWSYALLSEGEQRLMRRLAIFPGAFSFSSAHDLGAYGNVPRETVIEDLASLVAKSLVDADTRGAETTYVLLNTTRSFALDKLAGSGEHDEISRRYFADADAPIAVRRGSAIMESAYAAAG